MTIPRCVGTSSRRSCVCEFRTNSYRGFPEGLLVLRFLNNSDTGERFITRHDRSVADLLTGEIQTGDPTTRAMQLKAREWRIFKLSGCPAAAS